MEKIDNHEANSILTMKMQGTEAHYSEDFSAARVDGYWRANKANVSTLRGKYSTRNGLKLNACFCSSSDGQIGDMRGQDCWKNKVCEI